MLFFSSTVVLPNYLGGDGTIQGLRHRTLEFSPPPPRAIKQQGLIGLFGTDSCSGIRCEEHKKMLKALPPIHVH